MVLVRHASIPPVFLCIVGHLLATDDAPSREVIAKRSKATTALVEVNQLSGSSFCVHPSGFFVTNEHVVQQGSETVTLVLSAGLKNQKVFKAKVVRRDKTLDLALLKVEGNQQFDALELGSDKDLGELTDVIVSGFPFGRALARQGEYPEISINVGRVTSLQHATDGELRQIQLDAALNPGNSGGPVLGLGGKVVGVIVSVVPGSRVGTAIPVSHLQRFLAAPEIDLRLPTVTNANRHESFEFTAKVFSVLPSKEALDLELILGAGPGRERRLPMKFADGAYRARAVPFPAQKGSPVCRIEVKYEGGSVSGTTEDRTFRVGEMPVKLSQLRNLRLGAKAEAKLIDGQRREGKLADLDAIAVKVGEQSLRLHLADSLEINAETLGEVTELSCTILARQAGESVARHSVPLRIQGIAGPERLPEWTMDLKKMNLPDVPMKGKIFGAELKPVKVTWSNTGLSLQSATANMHIFLTLLPGQDTYEYGADDQQKRRLRPSIHLNSTDPPRSAIYQNDYAMRLEFGKEKEGKINGKIYLCLPDVAQSYIAGSFTLNVP